MFYIILMAPMFIYLSSSIPLLVKYVALITWLVSALREFGDFNARRFRAIILQVNEDFALKKVALVAYPTAIQKLVKSFSSIHFKQVLRARNKHADPLAILATKIDF